MYFLKEICGMDYLHLPELAPTRELLDEHEKQAGGWQAYATKFLALMKQRRIEEKIPKEVLTDGCLLCSEEADDTRQGLAG